MKTTVTVGNLGPENITDYTDMLSLSFDAFSVRYGDGYWEGHAEPSADFILYGDLGAAFATIIANQAFAYGEESVLVEIDGRAMLNNRDHTVEVLSE